MQTTESTSTLHTLATLYDGHGAAIYRYALGMLGRKEDAEDAVQTVWLKLAKARLGAVEDGEAYLWTAVRNHIRTAGGKRSRERLRTADEEPESLPLASNPGASAERLRDMESAVGRLRPKLRELIVLVGFEGLTLHEAAHRLGIPKGTASSRYHAALEKLRRSLAPGAERDGARLRRSAS